MAPGSSTYPFGKAKWKILPQSQKLDRPLNIPAVNRHTRDEIFLPGHQTSPLRFLVTAQ